MFYLLNPSNGVRVVRGNYNHALKYVALSFPVLHRIASQYNGQNKASRDAMNMQIFRQKAELATSVEVSRAVFINGLIYI